MTLWHFWLMAAALVLIVELFSGTFYLLVLSGALAGTGLLTFLFDFHTVASILMAAVLSGMGILIVRATRQPIAPQSDFDIGQTVKIEHALSNQTWRVFYRGTTWEARSLSHHIFAVGDDAKICGKDGIILIIDPL